MPGRSVAHYRITEFLGGGMGEVYAADTRLGRRVALTLPPRDLAADPIAVERFSREALAARTGS